MIYEYNRYKELEYFDENVGPIAQGTLNPAAGAAP
jgi:hypothetical protein